MRTKSVAMIGAALAVFGLVVLLAGTGACFWDSTKAVDATGHESAWSWWEAAVFVGVLFMGLGVQIAKRGMR